MLCSRVQNLLSAYLDRELTGADMLDVRHHLARCPECRAEHDGLLRVKRLMGRLAAGEPATAFSLNGALARPRLRPTWLRALERRAMAPWLALRDQYHAANDFFTSALSAQIHPVIAGTAVAAVVAGLATGMSALRRPQPADAVRAQVPVTVAMDDASLPAGIGGSLQPVGYLIPERPVVRRMRGRSESTPPDAPFLYFQREGELLFPPLPGARPGDLTLAGLQGGRSRASGGSAGR